MNIAVSSSRAYIAACAALHDLLIWESPLTSLMALFVGDAYHYSSLLVIDVSSFDLWKYFRRFSISIFCNDLFVEICFFSLRKL